MLANDMNSFLCAMQSAFTAQWLDTDNQPLPAKNSQIAGSMNYAETNQLAEWTKQMTFIINDMLGTRRQT